MKLDHLRLLGAFGSNRIMAGELSRLAKRALPGERSRELLARPPRKVGPGGLVYPYADDLAAVAVTYHRTSARVLWDVCLSSATRLEPLYDELLADFQAEQRPWFLRGGRLSVLAFGTQSVEAGERQVVGVVKNALLDAARARGIDWQVDPDSPDVILHARSVPTGESEGAKAELTVSIDLAGRPMHQRGYRLAHGDAPLREDLAASLVLLARHDARRQVLVDPLAGSGTILIEAALLACAQSLWPSGQRPLGARLPGLAEALSGLPEALFADTRAALFAAELDPVTAGHLQDNAVRAGVREQISLFQGDFRQWDLGSALSVSRGEPGLLLTNPPYGVRMGGSEQELGRLYRDLASFCRSLPGAGAGWTLAFIVGEAEDPERESSVALFLRSVGGKPRIRKPLANGPLRAQFLLYDL